MHTHTQTLPYREGGGRDSWTMIQLNENKSAYMEMVDNGTKYLLAMRKAGCNLNEGWTIREEQVD